MTSAKYWMITYNNPDEDIWEKFLSSVNGKDIKYIIYQKEVGESGTVHYQAYIQSAKRFRLTGLKKFLPDAHFDLAKGTPTESQHYCKKPVDGCLCKHCEKSRALPDNGILEPFKEIGLFDPVSQGKRNDILKAVDTYMNTGSLKRVAQDHPDTFIRYGKGMRDWVSIIETPDVIIKYGMDKFNGPTLDLTKACLLHGPSGIGKTEFAKAHFRKPLFISDIEGLKNLSKEHDGIVFDDMSFTHWPAESVIHLLDMDNAREIHCRYANAIIPAGVKRIFTHNEPHIFQSVTATFNQISAVNRRLNVYNVKENLIKHDA